MIQTTINTGGNVLILESQDLAINSMGVTVTSDLKDKLILKNK